MKLKPAIAGVSGFLLLWGASALLLDGWGHRALAARDADCIVVLGARVVPPGIAGLGLRARSLRAAELFHEGHASHIICTGGVGHTPPAESIVATSVLLSQRVPRIAIEREERSTSTWENAEEAAAICRARGWKRVIIVSDAYHVWRATRNFRAMGFEASAAAAPDPPPARRVWMSLREAILVVRDAFIGRL